jgi:hypothetical protein
MYFADLDLSDDLARLMTKILVASRSGTRRRRGITGTRAVPTSN